MKRSIQHTKLSQAVKKGLKKYALGFNEHRVTNIAAQKVLLERLGLPKTVMVKAKRLETHSLRLLEAKTLVEAGSPISVAMALKIIRETHRRIPEFIERNKLRLPASQLANLLSLKTGLENDLKRMKGVNGKLPTTLSLDFLNTSKYVHFDELKEILGEQKFRRYIRGMTRVQKSFAKHGEIMNWVVRTGQNN